MQEACPRCDTIKEKCKRKGSFSNFALLHTNKECLKTSRKSPDNRKFLKRFEKIVAALRNTEGGFIIIHVEGQWGDDRTLEDFDLLLTRRVENLIEDGQLYVNTFERDWLSSLEPFKDIRDVVLVQVRKTEGVTTVDFNTKIRSDFENKNPAPVNVISLLVKPSSESQFRQPLKELKWGRQISGELQVSRNVELKALREETQEYQEVKNDVSKLVDFIWSDLKLKDNITSMSKVKNGGSYFVGITQKLVSRGHYQTKIPFVEGFELHVDADDFERTLKSKIHSEVCVLCRDLFQEPDERLAQIKLHTNQEVSPPKHVLEVAIGYVDGVVFYDKEGPRTYIMENDFLKRMDKTTWLQRIKSINIGFPKQ